MHLDDTPTPHRPRVDLAVGTVGLLLALAVLVLIPRQIAGEGIAALSNLRSPAFFPVLAALAMAGLSGLVILRAGIGLWRHGGGPRAVPGPGSLRVAVVAAILGAAAAGMFTLGFLPTGVLTIAALAVLFDYRRPGPLLVVMLVVPGVIHLLFEQALMVMLPRGWW